MSHVEWWTRAEAIGTWIAAIATFLAVLVALFGPAFWDWWRRPRLTIEFRNEIPFFRYPIPAELIEADQMVYRIRVKVRNAGRSIARGCTGKLMEIRDVDGRPYLESEPKVLSWATSNEASMDINAMDYEYLNIVRTWKGLEHFAVRAADAISKGIQYGYPRGTYFLKITVLAENAEPVSRDYRLVWEGNYDNIKMYEVRKG